MEKAKILVVEDEAIIAMELESQLQSLGYHVTSVVNTGVKAIEKAEADQPDLILMDIRIKGEVDGIDTATMIRNRFGIPVVFSTAYLDEERIERAKITMPFGYVLKPIQERDLKVTLEMALYVSKVDAERKEAEERVRAERNRAQHYLDIAGVMLIALDTNGDVILINPKGCDILGYTEDEIIGRNWFDTFLPSEGIDDVKKVFNQIITGDIKPVEYYENPIVGKSGRQHFIAWHNSILYDNSGRMTGLFSSGEDITEKKRAEEELLASKNQYQTTIDHFGDLIHVVDTEFNIILGNEPFRRQIKKLGFGNEIDGRNLFQLAPFLTEKVHEEYLQVVNTGQPLITEDVSTIKGEEFFTETRKIPIVRDMSVKNVITVIRDISARKQAEEARLKEERWYRRLFESHCDAIYLIAEDGQIIDANEAAAIELGRSHEEILALSINDVDPNFNPTAFKEFWSGHPDDKVRIFETIHRRSDGTAFPVEVTGVPFTENRKRLLYGFAKDITERKKTEKEIVDIKEFYQEISEKAEDGIWVTDSNDKMIYFNPAMEKISDVTSADTIGLTVTTDFPEETISHFITFYNKARETLVPQHYEANVVTPVGRPSVQSGWLVPRIKNGRYNGIICTIQDITERRKLEQDFHKTDQ